MPEADIKKLATKLKKGLGARVRLNGGNVESVFRDLGKYVQPVADAGMDRAIKEIGRGMRGMGMGKRKSMKGMGVFDGINKFFTQDLPDKLVDVGIPVFTGTVGSVLGNAAGGPILGAVGGVSGRRGGQELAKKIRKSQGRKIEGDGIFAAGSGVYPAGVNLKRGSGMNSEIIQTGSPYIMQSSPAFNPVQLSNPFVSNNTVMRQAKSGGKTIRI